MHRKRRTLKKYKNFEILASSAEGVENEEPQKSIILILFVFLFSYI